MYLKNVTKLTLCVLMALAVYVSPVCAEKIIDLSNDVVLDKSLQDYLLDGATTLDNKITINGNNFLINGTDLNNNKYAGVTIGAGQALNFKDITLKNFTNTYLVENNGATNITSAILNNVTIINNTKNTGYGNKGLNLTSVILDNSNITNTGGIEFYGENELKKGSIDSTATDALVEIRQGATTVGKDFIINSKIFNFGGSRSNLPVATINNYGTINSQYANLNYTNINNYGTLMLESVQDLVGSSTNIVNNGEMFSSFLSLANNSKFTNNNKFTGVVKSGGEIINNGTIDGDVKLGFTLLGNIYGGTLTSKFDSITGSVQLIDGTNSIFNITGGTVKSTDTGKILGNGTINIIGAVRQEARLESWSGKTFVKKGGEVQVTGIEQSRIFTTGNITFEDGSTLNLRESRVPAGLQFTPTNLILAENDTLNLKMKDGLTLYAPRHTARGKFSLKELEISDGTSSDWQLIDDANNSDIYGRTSLGSDLKIIKTAPSASGVNYVTYDKSTGRILCGTQSLKDAIASVTDGNDHFYEMIDDESSDPSNYFDNGRLIVNGNNKTIHDINNITIGGQNSSGTLVLTNANLKNVTLVPDLNGTLVIRNSSNQAITLDNTTINNNSRICGVKFEGTNNINFNGEYNGISASGTVALDLGNATLTRNGNDNHAFWILNSGILKYANDSYLANGGMNALTFNGGNLDLRNGVASNIPLYGISLSKDSNIFLDVDLANSKMDSLDPSRVTAGGGKLKVAGLNLLSEAKDDLTTINFTKNSDLASNVEYTGDAQVAYSPIYKYNVDYNQSNGNFSFSRGNGVNSFNPTVLASPVAAQVGSYLAQLNLYEEAFTNMDMFMLLPREKRQAMKFANKYAFTQGTGNDGVITFSPNQFAEKDKGLWFRPYATFEKVGLKNGPSVSNVAYGSLFGGDSGLVELSRGWDMMYSLYAGYTGSHQAYNGVSIYQNGGTLGASGAWYKGNFFTGLTANVGANAGEASSRFGNDNFTMLATGIASKTGYNFELAKGKFVIQPNYLMSYTFVNTFDYTNSQGVRIDSNPLNAIQIAPGIKFIGQLKNGWQPYASVQMVWNILDKSEFRANNVSLPDMSVKPYVQYGVGVQKHVGERLTGFGQTMIRNGGRNGVALSFGFRWAIGK